MKKLYILFLFTALPLIGFGQVITNSTFDTDITGWASNGSASWSPTEGNVAVGSAEFVAASGNNFRTPSPNAALATAGDYTISFWVKGAIGTTVKAQVFNWISGNPSGPDLAMTGNWVEYNHTFIGCLAGVSGNVRIVGVTAGTFYIDDAYFTFQIPPGSTFLTTTTNGVGTITKTPDESYYAPTDNITVEAVPATHWLFENWTGDLTGSTNPETLLMDADKTITANFVVDPAFDYNFTFDSDGDLEGWSTDPQLTVATHTAGLVTLAPTANQFARFSLYDFPIPTSSYNKVTIKLQNNSINTNELAVIAGSTTTVVATLSTGDLTIQTYDIDLTQNAGWTGDVTIFRLRFADAANTGKPSDGGTIIIDDITFSYDPSLSVDDVNFKDDVSISLYPNPVQSLLTINTSNTVNKIEVFNILGQKMLSKENSATIDVSNLNKGVYISKIYQDNNTVSTKRFFKE